MYKRSAHNIYLENVSRLLVIETKAMLGFV